MVTLHLTFDCSFREVCGSVLQLNTSSLIYLKTYYKTIFEPIITNLIILVSNLLLSHFIQPSMLNKYEAYIARNLITVKLKIAHYSTLALFTNIGILYPLGQLFCPSKFEKVGFKPWKVHEEYPWQQDMSPSWMYSVLLDSKHQTIY